MIKIVICGIAGRMCGRIAALAAEEDDLEIVGGVESPGNPSIGQDLGELLGTGHTGRHVVEDLESVIGGADVAVAFTAPPEGTLDHAKIAAASGKAMVVGTTGFSNDQFSEFKKTLEPVPCVFAPSFSVGVTTLIKLVSTADTGYFYVAKKNARTQTEKLEFRKYDPVARKHVLFKEARIK